MNYLTSLADPFANPVGIVERSDQLYGAMVIADPTYEWE